MEDDMAAQLKALTDLVQQLQADNKREQMAQRPVPPADNGTPSQPSSGQSPGLSNGAPIAQSAAPGGSDNDGGRSFPSGAVERYVYIPRERKCPRFSGKVSQDSLPVEEWVDEARRHLALRPMPLAEQTLTVFDLLDGEAKREVKFRPAGERDSPTKIFGILTSIYGCTQSYVSLQKQFFQRRQLEGESVTEYSHALMHTLEAVKLKDPSCFANPDVVLRDQFIENVRDIMLKRELRRQVRLNPTVGFFDIRSEALRWVEEGEHTGHRPRAHSLSTAAVSVCEADSNAVSVTPNELTELKESLRRQQAQLEAIMKRLDSSQPTAPSSFRPQSRGSRLRFQPDGTPICSRCNQPGHIARFCSLTSSSNSRTELISHSHPQQQGN